MRPRAHRPWLLLALPLAGLLGGCFMFTACDGGGQNVSFSGVRLLNAADVAVPNGYTISIVAKNLNLPDGLCCDDAGNVCVVESGDDGSAPRLLRIDSGGDQKILAIGAAGSWTGLATFHGDFFVAESDPDGGRILRISPDGKNSALIENLPSLGDYPAGSPIVAPDGNLYFAEGSATNSGIVGPDNDRRGWLGRNLRFHDFPAAAVKLAGFNVASTDPFHAGNTAVTGAFSPFGQPTADGQIISGQVPCTGGVMRVPLAGGTPQLVAWGFRNPAGLAFSPAGKLYAVDQGYEDRGSRPVAGCGDPLWSVRDGQWYGFPDYFGRRPLAGARQFAPIAKPAPQFLLAEHPDTPPAPAAILPMRGQATGIDFSRSADFGHAGEAFVAEFGDIAPLSGKVLYPVGFEVLRVDVETGVAHVFAANAGLVNGPASKIGGGGFERPMCVHFNPAGDTLYVLDYGVVTVTDRTNPQPRTGVLWKITRKERD